MDRNDEQILTAEWNRTTDTVNDLIRQVQDVAYNLGLQRGLVIAAVIAESAAQDPHNDIMAAQVVTATANHIAHEIRQYKQG